MIPLDALLLAIAAHGPSVLLGVSAVLACGGLAMLAHRSIAQRRRLGVLTALAVLLYLAVGIAPLPRLAVAPVAAEAPAAGAPAAAPSVAQRVPTAAPEVPFLRDLPLVDLGAARSLQLADALAELSGTEPAPSNGAPVVPVADPVGLAVRVSRPPPAAAAPTASLGWGKAIAGLYLAGLLAMLVRVAVARWRLRALLAGCAPAPRGFVDAVALPGSAHVVTTDRVVRPFCAGSWRPCIVLPRALLAAGREAEALAVLRHELAHVQARDPRVWSLLAWLAVPLWCHPLFWWLAREVRFCSELLADDAAANIAGRERYARALIEFAEHGAAAPLAAGTVAIFHRPSEFYRRIQMLLSRRGSLSTSTSRLRRAAQALSMLGLVAAAASAFGVPAPAQEPAKGSLKQENRELRATIDALRDELGKMRTQIEALRASAQPGAAAGAPEDPAGGGGSLGSLLGGESDLTKGRAEVLRRALVDQRQKHMQDLFAEQAHVANTPAAPPQVAEPDVAEPGVPVLKDVPLIGQLFRNAPGEGQAVAIRDYEVQNGDSLDRIAARELGSRDRVREIMDQNPGLEPRQLRVGQRIRLPALPSANALAAAPRQPRGADANRTAPAGVEREFAPASATSGTTALAELTSHYLDLQAELEVQRVTVEETRKLAEAGHGTQRDAMAAAVRLRTLERKLAIATRLIDGEIAATEAELIWLDKRRGEASPREALQLEMQLQRARTRLESLQAAK